MPSRRDHIALKPTISTTHASSRLQKLALIHKRLSNGDSKLPINGNLVRQKFDDPDSDKKEKEKTMRSKEREEKESVRKEVENVGREEYDDENDFEDDDEAWYEYKTEIIHHSDDVYFNR